MTRKTISIDHLAAVSARQAQSRMAQLRRDLDTLRDGMAGLTRGIAAPVIRTPRHTIKRTVTDAPLWVQIAEFGLLQGGVASDLGLGGAGAALAFGASRITASSSGSGGSFYISGSQAGNNQMNDLTQAQRIR